MTTPAESRGWRSPASGKPRVGDPAAAASLIGNPSIADVAVKSGNLRVVVGKSFGITNSIAPYIRTHPPCALRKRNEGKVVKPGAWSAAPVLQLQPQCHPSITIADAQIVV